MPTSDPAETPEVKTIADGVHVRVAVDNIAWVDMGEYVLVVDALEQPELAEEVFAAIAATVPGKPVRYVINTHSHYDHVALNEAFIKRFHADIISQATASIPAEGRWFEGSRRRALMLPMPGCHTDEDCIVWIPGDRVLFVGDIFGWGLVPLVRNLRKDTARLLVATYTRLMEFDALAVIPGHGPLCTSEHLKRWVEYFGWLVEEVSEACSSGKKDSDIMRSVMPPEDMKTWWRFTQWKHEDSLSKVLKAVRKGWL